MYNNSTKLHKYHFKMFIFTKPNNTGLVCYSKCKNPHSFFNIIRLNSPLSMKTTKTTYTAKSTNSTFMNYKALYYIPISWYYI